MNTRAFTLIELLVVVAILALLAALAVPNFLEAQVRAKTSAALSAQRTIILGLEMYRIDQNGYPPTRSLLPSDPLALLASEQLRPLTTPVSYLTDGTFRDPFGGPQLYSRLQSVPAANPGLVDPDANMENPRATLLYYHFPSTAARLFRPQLAREAVALVSIGPDREDSLGAFARIPSPVFQTMFSYAGLNHPISTVYDPTNGTVSSGDVVTFTGNSRW